MAITKEDERIGKNFQAIRGEMTQEELAKKMREQGYKWSKATVWAIEKGERPLKVAEAAEVLRCLEMPADNISVFTNDSYNYKVMDLVRSVIDDCEAIDKEWTKLDWHRQSLMEAIYMGVKNGQIQEGYLGTALFEIGETMPETVLKRHLYGSVEKNMKDDELNRAVQQGELPRSADSMDVKEYQDKIDDHLNKEMKDVDREYVESLNSQEALKKLQSKLLKRYGFGVDS